MENKGDFSSVKLVFSDELRDLMYLRDIDEAYIRQVIAISERNGDKLINTRTGQFIAHLQIGKITCWVEYRPEGNGFRIDNAYQHRMEIGEER